jgi:hypothetical protein
MVPTSSHLMKVIASAVVPTRFCIDSFLLLQIKSIIFFFLKHFPPLAYEETFSLDSFSTPGDALIQSSLLVFPYLPHEEQGLLCSLYILFPKSSSL